MSESRSPIVPSPILATTSTAPIVCNCRSRVEPYGEGYRIFLQSPSLRVELLSYGAAVNSVKVHNPRAAATPGSSADEEWVEVALGYTSAEECVAPGSVIGATCGRYAGRIANGEFELNGTNYKLLQNSGAHTLHGGPAGFSRLPWRYLMTEGEDEIGVSFHLTSKHLDQGFPGELFVTTTYTISKHSPLFKYEHQASLSEHTPVAATVVNLANHTYWNLNGVPRPSTPEATAALPMPITNHFLKAPVKYFVETDEQLIPDGGMMSIENTVHDYTELRCIKEGMEATAELGREPQGYDDPIALEKWDSTLREAAVLYSPATKLHMRVCTTTPAVVVYTTNQLPEDASGAKGDRFQRHSGICLECQYFPNSPNVPSFPSTELKKGELYSETTTHEFKFLAASPI